MNGHEEKWTIEKEFGDGWIEKKVLWSDEETIVFITAISFKKSKLPSISLQ